MDYRKWIGEHVALIALLIVWSAIILYTFTRVPAGQIGTTHVMIYVLTVVAISVLLSIIPSIVVMFGWYSGKKVRAALLGVILLPAIFLLAFIVVLHDNMLFIRIPETVFYLSILSALSGIAGYCAGQRTDRGLAMAIVLVGLWVFCVLNVVN